MTKKVVAGLKTNAMRILDQKKIPYQFHDYSHTGALSGVEVAAALGQDPTHVFKTLVTVGKSKTNHVFVIPVAAELDLKKAAASVGEKSVSMLKMKDLFPTTGYVHGGCSPIGMKKSFHTVFDQTALNFDSVVFSAGKIGYQIEMNPKALSEIIPLDFADIVI